MSCVDSEQDSTTIVHWIRDRSRENGSAVAVRCVVPVGEGEGDGGGDGGDVNSDGDGCCYRVERIDYAELWASCVRAARRVRRAARITTSEKKQGGCDAVLVAVTDSGRDLCRLQLAVMLAGLVLVHGDVQNDPRAVHILDDCAPCLLVLGDRDYYRHFGKGVNRSGRGHDDERSLGLDKGRGRDTSSTREGGLGGRDARVAVFLSHARQTHALLRLYNEDDDKCHGDDDEEENGRGRGRGIVVTCPRELLRDATAEEGGVEWGEGGGEGEGGEELLQGLRCSSPSHVYYTSGSTGRPKGCLLRHRAVLNYCLDKNRVHGVARDSAVLLASAATFDPNLGDTLATWAAGATLVVPFENNQRSFLLHVTHNLTSPPFIPRPVRSSLNPPYMPTTPLSLPTCPSSQHPVPFADLMKMCEVTHCQCTPVSHPTPPSVPHTLLPTQAIPPNYYRLSLSIYLFYLSIYLELLAGCGGRWASAG